MPWTIAKTLLGGIQLQRQQNLSQQIQGSFVNVTQQEMNQVYSMLGQKTIDDYRRAKWEKEIDEILREE